MLVDFVSWKETLMLLVYDLAFKGKPNAYENGNSGQLTHCKACLCDKLQKIRLIKWKEQCSARKNRIVRKTRRIWFWSGGNLHASLCVSVLANSTVNILHARNVEQNKVHIIKTICRKHEKTILQEYLISRGATDVNNTDSWTSLKWDFPTKNRYF